MLSQFQTRYPTGSLISELLTISQGKFVVRVSAQVEGVTRATGMAAAETLEVAEDRARSRALTVLGIEQAVQILHPREAEADYSDRHSVETILTSEQQIQINATFSPERSLAVTPEPLHDLAYSSFAQALPQDGKQERELQERFSPHIPKSIQRMALTPTTTPGEDLGLIPEIRNESSGEAPNSLELPLNYRPQNASWLEPSGVEIEKKTSVPVDLSDAIARTGIEIKRLKWGNQQGREYLKQKYGKRSRQELTDEEMLEFLLYLESQPSPQEPD